MRYKKFELSIILMLGIALCSIQAQEAIPATGGEASGNGGSASYTIGQVFYTTSTETTGYVTQGVQQPYEISDVIGIEQTKGIILELTAFPNPLTDYLTLKAENYNTDNLSYQLFDMNGKLLESRKITGDKTEIEMINLVPAYYFLKIMENNNGIKTFKIIKN